MSKDGPPFYGKYRGVVKSNRDPLRMGRIRATVQDVLGSNESGWALPCVPYAGKGVGLFLIPPVGASVWIEFEHGNPDYPIWSGCFWAANEVPTVVTGPETKVIKTDVATITLNDQQGIGGITIKITSGASVVMNDEGIEVSSGSGNIKLTSEGVEISSKSKNIKLTPGNIEISGGLGNIKLSPQGVSINDGALEVT